MAVLFSFLLRTAAKLSDVRGSLFFWLLGQPTENSKLETLSAGSPLSSAPARHQRFDQYSVYSCLHLPSIIA